MEAEFLCDIIAPNPKRGVCGWWHFRPAKTTKPARGGAFHPGHRGVLWSRVLFGGLDGRQQNSFLVISQLHAQLKTCLCRTQPPSTTPPLESTPCEIPGGHGFTLSFIVTLGLSGMSREGRYTKLMSEPGPVLFLSSLLFPLHDLRMCGSFPGCPWGLLR